MSYYYSDPRRESDPHALPDVEVFEVWTDEHGTHNAFDFAETEGYDGPSPDMSPSGFYWQSGMPGYLPNGDPSGPFPTEREALEAYYEDDDPLDDDIYDARDRYLAECFGETPED